MGRRRNLVRQVFVVLGAAMLLMVVVAQIAELDADVQGYFAWERLNAQRNYIESAHQAPKDVYVNDVGRESALAGTFPFPEGTVLVKETIGEETLSVEVVSAMRKVAGFDEGGGDWQYAMFERQADGSFVGAWVATDHDMHAMCAGCHANAADTDFAFLSYLGD
jgi:hypothetical protein